MSASKKGIIYFLLWFLAAGCLLSVFLSAHKEQGEASKHYPEEPKRIVSLAPNITEILFQLGLEKQIAAVASESDYPPEAEIKKKVGTFWQPNVESILALKPDLVITLAFEQQRAVAETLRRLGYPVLTLNIKRICHLYEAIEKIGYATGTEDKASVLIHDIKKKLDEFITTYSGMKKIRVLWVIQNEPLRVAGRNTFLNEMIELAGGENAIGVTLQQYPAISTEELFACGTEVIIHSAMGEEELGEQQLKAEHFWSTMPHLPAVKNENIYVLDSDALLRLGPRIPEGVEEIADILHKNEQAEKESSG